MYSSVLKEREWGISSSSSSPNRPVQVPLLVAPSGRLWGASAPQRHRGGHHVQRRAEVWAGQKAWSLHNHLPVQRVDRQHHGAAGRADTGAEPVKDARRVQVHLTASSTGTYYPQLHGHVAITFNETRRIAFSCPFSVVYCTIKNETVM